jgi:iron complex outermembrane receptor protein
MKSSKNQRRKASRSSSGYLFDRALRRAGVAGSIAAAMLTSTATLAAAAADSDTDDVPALQEVVVTGSLIKRTEKESAEAITIIKADALKEQGITNVEQALNTLTTNAPSINIAASTGTFSGGGSYANLRGLGDGRTLVLLDGQRLANNAFTGDAVDLSGIPFSAIESVQVLREGASALYGSDAIAGVINFITKKSFQGAEIQGNLDRPQESGGRSGEVELTLGHGDLASDGYNVMITGSYSSQNELKATQRGFSATGFNPAGGYTSTNNPGTWPGTFLDANGNQWQSGYPACAGNPELTEYFGNCAYRYSAATDLLPQHSETSGLVSITKSLPADNTLQLQYFYTRSEVVGWSGPMFYFFQLDQASPYYPKAGQLTCSGGAANCSTPAPDLADGGYAIWSDPGNNRYAGNSNAEQRVLLTFSGSNAGWDYAAELNYSQNNNDNNLVSGYPNEAVLAPGGVLSDLINPFGPQTAAGQALINSSYIAGTYSIGEDKRWSAGAHASHPLGDAFNAGTPATVAFGFELSGERFTYATTPYNDIVSAATGLTDSAVEGTRQVQAAYTELDVPITKGLDLDVSDREDRYSDFGTTNNGKVALRYQPTDFLTLRGTASTGFRAPTLYDLYSPNFVAASSSGTMGSGNPFCQPGSYNTEWTPSVCNTQGLGVFGGNRNLTPETSQNFDLGVVLSPLRDLGITVDYYRILLKNTIGGVPESAIYGNPTLFANYIVTNNAGTLTPSVEEAADCHPYTAPTCGYIKLTDSNTGQITTNGIDISIQYQQQTWLGKFHEDLEGTAVTKMLVQQYTGGPLLNLAGWYNELAPAYKWQHNLRVDWESPGDMWGAGLSNRFWTRYIDEFPDGNGNQREVASYTLFDGYASYRPIPKLTVLFGVKNLLNRSPPFTNAYQGNFAAGYNSLTADPLLRNFYLNLKYTIF